MMSISVERRSCFLMQPLPHCRRLFPYRIVFKLFVTCTNWIFITTPFTDVYLLYMCPGDPELLLSQEHFTPVPVYCISALCLIKTILTYIEAFHFDTDLSFVLRTIGLAATVGLMISFLNPKFLSYPTTE